MSKQQKELQRSIERREGRRRDGSSAALRHCLLTLQRVLRGPLRLESDRKPLYHQLVRQIFGARAAHESHDSRARRDRANPLFPINHINAMHRYSLSRLRRRTWCITQKRSAAQHHLDLFLGWKNYCRGITRRTKTTPAQGLSVTDRKLSEKEFWYWREDWRGAARRLSPPRLAAA